jgi:hypothetical protein
MGQGGPLAQSGLDLSLHKVPLIGNFFQNPEETWKQAQSHVTGQVLGQYRPEMMEGMMGALARQAAAFQPVNNALLQSYGPSAQQMSFGSPIGGGGGIPYGLSSPLSLNALMLGQSMPGLQIAGMDQTQPRGGVGGLMDRAQANPGLLGSLPIIGDLLGGGGGGGLLGGLLGGK